MSTAEGAYRCAECKSWRHLVAWAAALIEGPLDADGDLVRYDYVEDCYLHEDSIHCTKHMSAGIEMFRSGRWCRWWTCDRCGGVGRVGINREYDCMGGLKISEDRWGRRVHRGWLRPEQIPALETSTASS